MTTVAGTLLDAQIWNAGKALARLWSRNTFFAWEPGVTGITRLAVVNQSLIEQIVCLWNDRDWHWSFDERHRNFVWACALPTLPATQLEWWVVWEGYVSICSL